MKIKCVITNIDWDTDGEEIKELPKDVTFEIDYDEDDFFATVQTKSGKYEGVEAKSLDELRDKIAEMRS